MQRLAPGKIVADYPTICWAKWTRCGRPELVALLNHLGCRWALGENPNLSIPDREERLGCGDARGGGARGWNRR